MRELGVRLLELRELSRPELVVGGGAFLALGLAGLLCGSLRLGDKGNTNSRTLVPWYSYHVMFPERVFLRICP